MSSGATVSRRASCYAPAAPQPTFPRPDEMAEHHRHGTGQSPESETLLVRPNPVAPSAPVAPGALRPPKGRRPRPNFLERVLEARSLPYLRLGAYYVVLIGIMGLLIWQFPFVRDAFVAPTVMSMEEGGSLAGPVIGDSTFAPTHGAPEHFKPSYGPLGPWTDVYGLALTFVEVVSGRRPLDGADDT